MKTNKIYPRYVLFSILLLAALAGANATRAAELTLTINGRGTVSPTYKGKNLNVGQPYPIKATASAGFEFTNWIETSPTDTVTNTSAKMTFTMVSGLQLTANFLDIEPPTLKITTKPGTGSNSVVTISGTAKDNVGVEAVWCQIGSGGNWTLAATSDAYTNWTAVVILSTGANTINVYAEDAAGNRSPTESVTLTDDSTGFAPETLAGTTLQLVAGNASAVRSFGESTFSDVAGGNAGTGVGTYTYIVIDANTAQEAFAFTLPPTNAAGTLGSDVTTLLFTNGTSGTWAHTNGASGTFTLSAASSTAPASISGLTVEGADTGGNVYQFTNAYGNGSFTATDTTGTFSGSYTYEQYSPVAGMVQETLADGTTDYVLLDFSTDSNTYWAESIDITNGLATNAGTFSVSGETSAAGYTGPVSLAGYTLAVSQVKTDGTRNSFDISLSAGTFADFSKDTNHDSGVGTYTYTRTGAKTATFLNTYLAPPEEAANDGGTPVSFVFTSSHSATVTTSDGHGTVTFSEPASTVPLSLQGRTLTGRSKDGSGTISFTYGTFSGGGHDGGGTGTYTYTPYGPQVALVIRNYTDSSNAGTTDYLILWFSSATGGSYVDNKSSGSENTGTFTMK